MCVKTTAVVSAATAHRAAAPCASAPAGSIHATYQGTSDGIAQRMATPAIADAASQSAPRGWSRSRVCGGRGAGAAESHRSRRARSQHAAQRVRAAVGDDEIVAGGDTADLREQIGAEHRDRDRGEQRASSRKAGEKAPARA